MKKNPGPREDKQTRNAERKKNDMPTEGGKTGSKKKECGTAPSCEETEEGGPTQERGLEKKKKKKKKPPLGRIRFG